MTTYKVMKRGREVVADFSSKEIAAGGYFDPISVVGSGELYEIMILSPNTSFGVTVAVDGTTILSKTYTELHAITQPLRSVSAFPELDEDGDPTGQYLIHLKDISFLESLVVRVTNTGGASANFNILGKYNIS